MGGCQPSFDREGPWFFGIILQSKKHVQNEGVSFIENFKSQSKNDLLTICSNTPAAFFGFGGSPRVHNTRYPKHLHVRRSNALRHVDVADIGAIRS